MDKYKLTSVQNECFSDSSITVMQFEKRVKLIYKCVNTLITEQHEFPFFALQSLRLTLENQNVKLLCNGSRIDVYPSGQSAIGFLAYVLEVGKQATTLVNIFDEANIHKIGTVKEQNEFRLNWLKSLSSN